MRISTFNDLPTFNSRPAGAISSVSRSVSPRPMVWRLHRRRFLQIMLATGSGLALQVLGLLPPARAGHESNDDGDGNPGNDAYEIRDNCYSNYGASCGDACCCSTDCPSCCDQSGNHTGWHKSNGTTYKLRKDQCGSSTDWDGWKWEESSCGCCDVKRWRCHDGKACDSNGNNCNNTICPWVIACISSGC
jgi:hypothetical protein